MNIPFERCFDAQLSFSYIVKRAKGEPICCQLVSNSENMHCRHSWARVTILFGVVLVAVFVLGSGGVVGETQTGSEIDPVNKSPYLIFEPILFQSESTANSSDQPTELPPPHRNPTEIESSDSSAQLEALLRASINQNLAGSIENLDEGQYELAREQLGEDFEEDLRRYAESSEEFNAEEQAELFSSIESNQEAYIDAVDSYENSQAAYESARESNETTRSRELGRQLITDAERVSTTGENLADNYRELGNQTEQDFSGRTETIEQRQQNASDTATTVSGEFTETSVSATANRSAVNFTEAIQLSGEVQAPNSSVIEPHQAVIRVTDQSYMVDVGSDGRFELVVKPDGVWEETDELNITYQPTNESTLLESKTTFPLSVSTTETRLEIDSVSDQASYDSPLKVNGTLLTDDGEPVPGTPVSVRTAGTELATIETSTAGRFSIESSLPTTIPSGESTFFVGTVPSSRAVNDSVTEIIAQIDATDPTMSVNATLVEASGADPRLAVDGQLTSPDGRSIEGESMTVFVEGEAVGELTTDSQGLYRGQFDLPDGTTSGTEIAVEATYEPTESNLNAVSESTTVVLPETLLESVGLSPDDAVSLGMGAVVGLVGVLGGAGWWLRQTPDQQALSTETDQSGSPGEGGADSEDLLTSATAHLNTGANETAATIAYVATRRELSETVDVAETATHWEWYQACAAAGVDQISELETLVDAFEQVVFAPDTEENPTAANRAVSTARHFCDTDR